MVTLTAWVAFPVAFYLVAVGLGLGSERVARTKIADGLLAPSGACVAFVLAMLVLQLKGDGLVMAGVLVVLAVAGLVLSRRGLGRRLAPGWPGVAALLAFALYIAPAALTGHWTWLGYNFVNDTATNFAVIDHLADHGTALLIGTPSTRMTVVNNTLEQNYPLGAHALLAAFKSLVPAPVEAVYQPFIAALSALAAMSLAWLAQTLRVPRPVGAAAAVVAVGANLTYQYSLHGAFKEVAVVLVIATAAALARLALDARLAPGTVALLAVCLVAGVVVFAAGAVGYAVALAATAVVAVAVERSRLPVARVARAAGLGAAVMAIAALPVLVDSLKFAERGSRIFADTNADLSAPLTSPEVLGHLVRPLPRYQSLGTWLRADYRYPVEPGLARTLTTLLLVVGAALLVTALVVEWRRRRFGVLLAFAPALLVYVVAAPRLEPYADAKLLVILSPMAVFGAAIGAYWLFRRWRPVGAVLGAALAVGVLVSDALAYHSVRVAPVERLTALRDAAEHAGEGAWLLPEWEELAKAFTDPAAVNVGPESFSPRPVLLRERGPIFHRSFDLDALELGYVESWPGIVLRRSPEASRPPANYSLVYRNGWYELWRRRSGPEVLEHLPLQRPGQPAAEPRCGDVLALARRAGPGEQLVAARRSTLPTIGVTKTPLPGATRPTRAPGWPPPADIPASVIPVSPGVLSGRLTLAAGTYRAWVKGGDGRPLSVAVDGHPLGAVQDVNTPDGWLMFGTIRLPASSHSVVLTRPGGSVAPGNGYSGVLSGIALEPQTSRDLVSVAPGDARRLCGRSWDWIELVRDAPRP